MHWNKAYTEYICVDGTRFSCRIETIATENDQDSTDVELDLEEANEEPIGSGDQQRDTYVQPTIVPRNGLLLRRSRPPVILVSLTTMTRDATEIVRGGPARTYVFPKTAAAANREAFAYRKMLQSVRFNEGLKTLRSGCFQVT